MAQGKAAVTPLLTHWRYYSLVLSQRYEVEKSMAGNLLHSVIDISQNTYAHMPLIQTYSTTQIAKSMGQHGAHLGPVGPRWPPYRPHEPCYQDMSNSSEHLLGPLLLTWFNFKPSMDK